MPKPIVVMGSVNFDLVATAERGPLPVCDPGPERGKPEEGAEHVFSF